MRGAVGYGPGRVGGNHPTDCKTIKVPVTVKTRLGWDEDSVIIEDLAEALQDVGIAALTIHGRTRAQMYKGQAD